MNEVREALFYEATQIATGFQRSKVGLEKRKSELEMELLQVANQIKSLEAIPQRLTGFKALFTTHEAWCPRCWIQTGDQVALKTINGTDKEDLFRCKTCSNEFSVPI